MHACRSTLEDPTLGCLLLIANASAAEQASSASPVSLNIQAQPLADALAEFAQQTGLQMIVSSEVARNIMSPRLAGDFTPEAALKQLLASSTLQYHFINPRTVAIRAVQDKASFLSNDTGAGPMRLAQAAASEAASPSQAEGQGENRRQDSVEKPDDPTSSKGIPEILVKGSRSLNMDIQRTRDDTQPYVTFDAAEIERSHATSLEEFFKTRLPMNSVQGSDAQNSRGGADTFFHGNQSAINLRGLGANQTLILVDGRRLPNVNDAGASFDLRQPDINGIPLSAIERIEVLPSTASGIYGGGATGGVVNIILKREYSGKELRVTYGDTFRADARNMKVDGTAGFALAGGRTRVMIFGSHDESDRLSVGDRDFVDRARALQLQNNRAELVNRLPFSATPNIRSNTLVGGVRQNLCFKAALGGQCLTSPITFIPAGYAGIATGGTAPLLANSGAYNLALADDLNGRKASLLNNPVVDSWSANIRQELGRRVEAFADFSWSHNEGRALFAPVASSVALPISASNNPFQQAISVTFPNPNAPLNESRSDSRTLRATGGFIVQLPGQWTAEADYNWGRSRQYLVGTNPAVGNAGTAPARTALLNGTLNVIQDTSAFPFDFTPYLLPSPNEFVGPFDTILQDATLKVGGPAFDLPGGPLVLTGLAEVRREHARSGYTEQYLLVGSPAPTPSIVFYPDKVQETHSLYAEARAPLVSAANAKPFLEGMELQASVRRDDYRTRAPNSLVVPVTSRTDPIPDTAYTTNKLHSTDYTLGLRWTPIADVVLRGSYGTGFLPPNLQQLMSSTITITSVGIPLLDPKRGGTDVDTPYIQVIDGSHLGPEQSESLSAGLILTPRLLPGLRFSADYTRISKRGEISGVDTQYLLNNEDQFPGRIVRGGASQPGDLPGWATPITSIEVTAVNLARKRAEVIDFQADYTWESGRLGTFHPYLIATHQTALERQVLATSPLIDTVGFKDGPLSWRGNAGLNWDRGPWSVGWNAQYYGHYFVYSSTTPATGSSSIATAVLNQGSATIPSQMYHDLSITYSFDKSNAAGEILAGTTIGAGIQNIFDKHPPTIVTTAFEPYGGYSLYGDPRLRRFTLTITKQFGR